MREWLEIPDAYNLLPARKPLQDTKSVDALRDLHLDCRVQAYDHMHNISLHVVNEVCFLMFWVHFLIGQRTIYRSFAIFTKPVGLSES